MRRAKALAGLLAALACAAPQAVETVACHVDYGGETRLLKARPTADPYTVEPVAVGTYFLFRIVFRRQPADLAGIKLYAYANQDEGPLLLHQASHPYPPPAGVRGFTGRIRVYEPMRDGELEYWCELTDEAAP